MTPERRAPTLAEYWQRRAENAEVAKVTAIQDFARAAAEEIRRELVCCDVYERMHGLKLRKGDDEICFWSEASARIVERRAGLRGPCACERCSR